MRLLVPSKRAWGLVGMVLGAGGRGQGVRASLMQDEGMAHASCHYDRIAPPNPFPSSRAAGLEGVGGWWGAGVFRRFGRGQGVRHGDVGVVGAGCCWWRGCDLWQ